MVAPLWDIRAASLRLEIKSTRKYTLSQERLNIFFNPIHLAWLKKEYTK